MISVNSCKLLSQREDSLHTYTHTHSIVDCIDRLHQYRLLLEGKLTISMDWGHLDHVNLCSASTTAEASERTHTLASQKTVKKGCSYPGRIGPSSVHSAALAGAWWNPAAQHTDRGGGKTDYELVLVRLGCLRLSAGLSFARTLLCQPSSHHSPFLPITFLTFWANSRSPCDFAVCLAGSVFPRLTWAALPPLCDLYESSSSLSVKPSHVHCDPGLSDPPFPLADALPDPPMMTDGELSVRKTSVSSSACSESLNKRLSLELRESKEGWEEVLPCDCIPIGTERKLKD